MSEKQRDGDDFDDASQFGPISNPVDRFGHLPEGTRRWLEELRAEDISDLREAMKFHHSAKAAGRFIKWIILSIVAIFSLAALAGESIQKMFGFFRWWFKG